ncbi:YCF48-related protein [Fulvivirgaceae bacterium BMA12]|uniref:YCF48-related protein n=1 Tax=Agaribacillus aureus TaxID=3051825 RepID=A0ABT8LBT1_9BACT|nr:YCF48-related protein [Fulvivirgaceae bacterium BMA12]
MRLYFVCLVLLLVSEKICAQWQKQHPGGFNNSMYKIIQPPQSDKSYVFSSGALTIIDDLEKPSQTQPLGLPIEFKNNISTIHTTARYRDVFFTSENTGYLIHKNVIYKTTDRGGKWEEVLNIEPNRDKFSTSAYFESLFFVDENVGYAVGWFEKIFKTTDGGKNWDTLRWSKSATPFRRLTGVHFLNADVGFVAGYEIDDYFLNIGVYQHFLMTTTNGGKTWTETLLGGESDHQLANFQFLNDKTGYLLIANQNRFFPIDKIIKTTDGGATWEQLPLPNMVIRNMTWVNEDIGFAAGGPGFVLEENLVIKTVDGGKSWTTDTLPTWKGFNMNHCFDIKMQDAQRGLVVGAGGSVYYTTDQGENWQTGTFTYPDIEAIDMVSDKVGYAAGANGLFMKTTDGQQWDTLPNTGYFNALSLDFKDESEGLLLTSHGLHATANGGLLWEDTYTSTDTVMLRLESSGTDLWTIARVNSQKDLILMKSEDQGKSWQAKPVADITNSFTSTFDLAVIKENTLLVSIRDQILRTENGGASWETVISLEAGPSDFFLDVFTVDEESAFAYSQFGKVWKTTDGGLQWEEIYEVPYFYKKLKVFFKNSEEGFLLGFAQKQAEHPQDGVLLYTGDGGQNWTEQDIPKNEGLFDLAWTPDLQSVYVVGKFGTILKLGQEEVVTGIEGEEKANFLAYPNPARDLLHFSLSSVTNKQVQVELLDPLGRRVLQQNLILNNEQAGSIDLRPYNRGLYILNITADRQKMVEKVILSGD